VPLDPAVAGNLLAAAGLTVTIGGALVSQTKQIVRLTERVTDLYDEMRRHCDREERLMAEIRERVTFLERHRRETNGKEWQPGG
jgi:hypothetical protein